VKIQRLKPLPERTTAAPAAEAKPPAAEKVLKPK
jgi:hypothetical protein